MRVSIVATALDGQQPEAKSVINMVHRIQNRNPGYSDFSNIGSSHSLNSSSNIATPVIDGATALKLENEITEQLDTEISNSNEIETTSTSPSTSEESLQEINNEIALGSMENLKEAENDKVSNGLENFGLENVEKESPELFNSEISELDAPEKEFTSFDDKVDSEEEDELEIPAFLRRQQN